MAALPSTATSLELRELLCFPARALAGLPIPVRIELQVAGIHHTIDWTSERFERPAQGLIFDGDEVRAIALGVEAERLWPADLKGFCLRKLHDPSFRVTEGTALDGAQPSAGRAWPLARVLRWLELELVAFAWAGGSEAPAEPQPIGAAA